MRIRQSLLNFATMVLFLAVTMSVALFATPWLEAWLGTARFGAFRVVIDCQGYLTLLELGLGGALAPLLARALGQGMSGPCERMIAAGVRAYLCITLLTLAAGLALTPLIPRFAAQLTCHRRRPAPGVDHRTDRLPAVEPRPVPGARRGTAAGIPGQPAADGPDRS